MDSDAPGRRSGDGQVPTPSQPTVTAQDRQDRYGLLWGEIENTAIEIGARGCVGAQWVAATERLILYWFDEIPAPIADIIQKWGLPLEVRFVPFPPDVLHAQSRKLVADPAVTSAGCGHDFQSISLAIREGTPADDIIRLGQDIPVVLEPAVAARFPTVTCIPVAISTITSTGTIACSAPRPGKTVGRVMRKAGWKLLIVSATFVTPYPPGFPVLVPGQRFSASILEFMSSLDTPEVHGYRPALGYRVFTDAALDHIARSRRAVPAVPSANGEHPVAAIENGSHPAVDAPAEVSAAQN